MLQSCDSVLRLHKNNTLLSQLQAVSQVYVNGLKYLDGVSLGSCKSTVRVSACFLFHGGVGTFLKWPN